MLDVHVWGGNEKLNRGLEVGGSDDDDHLGTLLGGEVVLDLGLSSLRSTVNRECAHQLTACVLLQTSYTRGTIDCWQPSIVILL